MASQRDLPPMLQPNVFNSVFANMPNDKKEAFRDFCLTFEKEKVCSKEYCKKVGHVVECYRCKAKICESCAAPTKPTRLIRRCKDCSNTQKI